MTSRARRGLLVVTVVGALACASGPSNRAAALPAGCTVETLSGGPPARPVENLGQVVARCRGAAGEDPAWCTRELQNQACGLGATLIWGVSSRTTEEHVEMRAYAGRYR